MLHGPHADYPSPIEEDIMAAFTDYIVKDIALAEFGRKEISIAETEMPA